MADTFRAMCAELVRRWDAANGDHDLLDVADAMARTRTLLAQQPVSPPYKLPEAEGWTDEELLAMRSWSSHGHTFDSDLVDYARAAIAADRARRPTPQHEELQP